MSLSRDSNRPECPDCGNRLSGLYCSHCEFKFFDCPICNEVFDEESDAADCEYDHRTVLDDLADVV